MAITGCGKKELGLDKVLETKDFKVENKKFFFDLKENPKGKYLRITESSGGRSSIVIPENGLFGGVSPEPLPRAAFAVVPVSPLALAFALAAPSGEPATAPGRIPSDFG